MLRTTNIELTIPEEDREKGHDLAQADIQALAQKLESGEITHQQLTGYIWEMRILCDEMIDILAGD